MNKYTNYHEHGCITRKSKIKTSKSHVLIINNEKAIRHDNKNEQRLPINYHVQNEISSKVVLEIEFYRYFRQLFASLYYPFNQQIQKVLMYQIRLLNIYHDCKHIDDLFRNILNPIVRLLWMIKNEILEYHIKILKCGQLSHKFKSGWPFVLSGTCVLINIYDYKSDKFRIALKKHNNNNSTCDDNICESSNNFFITIDKNLKLILRYKLFYGTCSNDWQFVTIESKNYKYLFCDKHFLHYLIADNMNYEVLNKNLSKIDKYLAFNETRSYKQVDIDAIICDKTHSIKSTCTRTRSNSSATLIKSQSDTESNISSGKFTRIIQKFPTFNANKGQLSTKVKEENNQLFAEDSCLSMNQSFSNSFICQKKQQHIDTNKSNFTAKLSKFYATSRSYLSSALLHTPSTSSKNIQEDSHRHHEPNNTNNLNTKSPQFNSTLFIINNNSNSISINKLNKTSSMRTNTNSNSCITLFNQNNSKLNSSATSSITRKASQARIAKNQEDIMSKSSIEPIQQQQEQMLNSSLNTLGQKSLKKKKLFKSKSSTQTLMYTCDDYDCNKNNLQMLDNHLQSVNITELNFMILEKACITLPGLKDKHGNYILFMWPKCVVIDSEEFSSNELEKILLYYWQILQNVLLKNKFTIIIEATNVENCVLDTILGAIYLFETTHESSIYNLIIICDAHTQFYLNNSQLQVNCRIEILSDPIDLLKFINLSSSSSSSANLCIDYLVTNHHNNSYNHSEWINFRIRIEPFLKTLKEIVELLLQTISDINSLSFVTYSTLDDISKTTFISKVNIFGNNSSNNTIDLKLLGHLTSSKDIKTIIEQLNAIIQKTLMNPLNISFQNESQLIINMLKDLSKLKDFSLFNGNHQIDENFLLTSDMRVCIDYSLKLYDETSATIRRLERLLKHKRARFIRLYQFKKFNENQNQLINWITNEGKTKLNQFLNEMVNNLLVFNSKQDDSSSTNGAMSFLNLSKQFQTFYAIAINNMQKGKKFVDDLEKCSRKLNSNIILSQNGTGIIQINDNLYYDVNSNLLKENINEFEHELNDANCKLEWLRECYCLLDEAYEWALNTMRYVASMKIENLHTKHGLDELHTDITRYIRENPLIDESKFVYMCDLARKIDNQKLVDKCDSVRTKCVETLKWLELRQNTIERIKCQSNRTNDKLSSQSPIAPQKSSLSQTSLDKIDEEESSISSLSMSHDEKMDDTLTQTQNGTVMSIESSDTIVRPSVAAKQTYRFFDLFSFKKRKNRVALKTASPTIKNIRDEQSLSQFDLPSISSQAQKLDITTTRPPHSHRHSYSYTESSNESKTTCNCKCNQENPLTLSETNLVQFRRQDSKRQSPTVMEDLHQTKLKNVIEVQKENLKSNSLPYKFMQHTVIESTSGNHTISSNFEKVINELLQTEKDYVDSLNYVIENFIPEMKQVDILQPLRGKTSVIFGNIEMIYSFHMNNFLQELNQCQTQADYSSPQSSVISIANCFLNHKNDFHLYALYSKNKPKSDALMLEVGAKYFKKKQLELGDYLDLSSYLLKPVQRLGKYALLLRQLLKEFPLNSLEYAKLKQAEELMKFQLRHGNDLLAMDCIRDSDINLLEQGQLIRQDEMIVQVGTMHNGQNEPFSFSISHFRAKKSLRRVFLFEDVIVFTKIKRNLDTKQDVYLYRTSLKLSDIGLTESIGSNELKFEIWFRRYNHGHNYILQAPNMDVKQAWITNIHLLLDRQMQKVKEKRLLELTSMGLGSKPCSDLPPSSNQIIDRSINIPIRNARVRNSIAVSHFDTQTSMKTLSNSAYNTFKISLKQNDDHSKRPTSTVSITSTHTSGLSSFASSTSSQFQQQQQQQPQTRNHRSHTLGAITYNQEEHAKKSKTLQSLASNESGIVPDILKDCCNNANILHIDHESNTQNTDDSNEKINV